MSKKRISITVFIDEELDSAFNIHLAKYGRGSNRGPFLRDLLIRDIEAHRCGQAAELEADMWSR